MYGIVSDCPTSQKSFPPVEMNRCDPSADTMNMDWLGCRINLRISVLIF